MAPCIWIDSRILYRRKKSLSGKGRRHREKALARVLTAALQKGYTIYECDDEGKPFNDGWSKGGGAARCYTEPWRHDAGFLASHIARRTFGWRQSLRIVQTTEEPPQ